MIPSCSQAMQLAEWCPWTTCMTSLHATRLAQPAQKGAATAPDVASSRRNCRCTHTLAICIR
eukprot:scaffold7204_cov354-Prasinococcus_capsulatus_cf.AAC.5